MFAWVGVGASTTPEGDNSQFLCFILKPAELWASLVDPLDFGQVSSCGETGPERSTHGRNSILPTCIQTQQALLPERVGVETDIPIPCSKDVSPSTPDDLDFCGCSQPLPPTQCPDR